MVGKSCWRLFCFLAHTILSAPGGQGGLYHQRQAILRNSSESLTGLKLFAIMLWSWRKRPRRSQIRLPTLIGISGLLAVGFYVASIFSSQVSLTVQLASALIQLTRMIFLILLAPGSGALIRFHCVDHTVYCHTIKRISFALVVPGSFHRIDVLDIFILYAIYHPDIHLCIAMRLIDSDIYNYGRRGVDI